MIAGEAGHAESLQPAMIAPCGMNCGLCSRHLREKDRCLGCRSDDPVKPRYCAVCRIRNCEEIAAGGRDFCLGCSRFPCPRLRHLDKRYRTTYGMSMLENLDSIQELGLEGFVARERERWTCPGCGGILCVHKERCIHCGHPRP